MSKIVVDLKQKTEYETFKKNVIHYLKTNELPEGIASKEHLIEFIQTHFSADQRKVLRIACHYKSPSNQFAVEPIQENLGYMAGYWYFTACFWNIIDGLILKKLSIDIPEPVNTTLKRFTLVSSTLFQLVQYSNLKIDGQNYDARFKTLFKNPTKRRDLYSRLHPKIKPNDLGNKSDLKLLSETETNFVREYKIKNPNAVKIPHQRKLNEQCKLNYSVIFDDINKTAYALYRGKEFALGRGGLAIVKLGQNIETGEWVAVKIVQSSYFKFQALSLAWHQINSILITNSNYHEVDLIKNSKRNGILIGHLSRTTGKSKGLYTQFKEYYIQKLISGNNLYELMLCEKKPLTEIEKLTIAKLTSEALKNMHDNDEIFRDLKSKNIIYDREKLNISFIDFDSSYSLNGKNKLWMTSLNGTTSYYLSPEASRWRFIGYTASKKSDIYALGKIFEDLEVQNNKALNELINTMLDQDPEKRPNIDQVIVALKNSDLDRSSSRKKHIRSIII